MAPVAPGLDLATPTPRAPADQATSGLAPLPGVRLLEELDRLLATDAVCSADVLPEGHTRIHDEAGRAGR